MRLSRCCVSLVLIQVAQVLLGQPDRVDLYPSVVRSAWQCGLLSSGCSYVVLSAWPFGVVNTGWPSVVGSL